MSLVINGIELGDLTETIDNIYDEMYKILGFQPDVSGIEDTLETLNNYVMNEVGRGKPDGVFEDYKYY